MQNIIQCYKNHPSIIKIEENFKNLAPFDFPKPTVEDISLIIKRLNPKKATSSDCIYLKIVNFASNFIESCLFNIIMKDLEKNKYSEEPKTALVKTIFKKI